jgi:hypothetical protein
MSSGEARPIHPEEMPDAAEKPASWWPILRRNQQLFCLKGGTVIF